MGFGSDLINADKSPVQLEFHDELFLIEGTTLSGHMLEGQRFWMVHTARGPYCDCNVTVTTWAYERKVGFINDWGAYFAGTEAQMLIWDQYLINVRESYDGFSAGSTIGWDNKPLPTHQEAD